jgi:hypothetical protein
MWRQGNDWRNAQQTMQSGGSCAYCLDAFRYRVSFGVDNEAQMSVDSDTQISDVSPSGSATV